MSNAAIRAVFTADTTDFDAKINQMASKSTVLNAKPPPSVRQDYVNFWKSAIDEKAKVEIASQRTIASQTFSHGGIYAGGRAGSGIFGRFGVAGSMFTSVARDSAASLASGAPITQVIAQQAPQVLQAMAMMRLGMVALQVSVIGAAAVVTGYLAKAFYDSYFEVQRTLDVTKQLERGLVAIAAKRKVLRAEDINETNAKIRELRQQKELIQNQNEVADAAAELSKQEAKAEFYSKNVVHSKREELELEQKLLAIELERAEAKAKQLQDSEIARQTAIAEAEVALKKANDAYDIAHAEDVKKAYGVNTSKVTPFQDVMLIDAINDATDELEFQKEKNDQSGMDKARAEVLRIKNQISALKESSVELKDAAKAPITSVTDRQRIGAFSNNSIQVSLLDVNKKQEQHLREMRNMMSKSDGSF
jgi:hypothetical protein